MCVYVCASAVYIHVCVNSSASLYLPVNCDDFLFCYFLIVVILITIEECLAVLRNVLSPKL